MNQENMISNIYIFMKFAQKPNAFALHVGDWVQFLALHSPPSTKVEVASCQV